MADYLLPELYIHVAIKPQWCDDQGNVHDLTLDYPVIHALRAIPGVIHVEPQIIVIKAPYPVGNLPVFLDPIRHAIRMVLSTRNAKRTL